MTWRADAKFKSAVRKPLRDVSNSGVSKPSKKSALKLNKTTTVKFNSKNHRQQQNYSVDEDPIDRLLFLHSDISSLLRQIDELVVQAVKVKITDNDKSAEIKSFTDVLSGIHSTIKPWVLRLQKALAIPPVGSAMQLAETSLVTVAADQAGENEIGTPEPSNQESLVSPSPLVSWRATDCAVEIGKQLFLLTPLPRTKTSLSKYRDTLKPATCQVMASSTAGALTYLGDNGKLTCNKPETGAKSLESTSDSDLVSPVKIPIGEPSIILATPCPQNCKPSSCVQQETDPRLFCRKIGKSHKSTPFPVGTKFISELTDSDSSSTEVSEKLGLKYPELIGIKPSCTWKSESRILEASPAWMRSPPKCCTLLEPVDEIPARENAPLSSDLQELANAFNKQIRLVPPKASSIKLDQVRENKDNFHHGNIAMVDSTPCWKGSKSNMKGKHPGENTLKKELWTKFEAASTNAFHLNFSDFKDTSQKGFLDRLEEASCDETCSPLR